MIQLHNTLTNKTQEFSPASDTVSLYTCGPTVYSEPHIGNWVSFIRWDILVRVLRANDLRVNRVMNITDVGHLTSDADEGEDKMLKGARREGVTEWEVAERYTNRFLEGMTRLNLLPPEHLTKATEHIDIQIELVKQLEQKGFTYVLGDGVYFDTSKFPSYAKFAHLDLEAQKAGARVEFNTDKRNPSDFVVWRLTPEGESRAMEWDSPWGKGIPGWHLECSAMAMHYLGESIDIHTGGIDHIPVHHTNEIAQSEAATGKPFARFWLHNSHLLSDGTKLSKSLKNSYTLDDIAEKGFSAMDLRMFILQSHYRTETNFTWENLEAARNRLRRWKQIACLRWQTHDTLETDVSKDHDANATMLAAQSAVVEAISNDLNTPEAIVAAERAFDAIEAVSLGSIRHDVLTDFISHLDDLFGLQLSATTSDITDDQKQLIITRRQARDSKDWSTSDKIRDELLKDGVVLNDTAHRTIWYKA
jgi:cysteinyl-tRNA synthetase